ncbi:hypothetical protein EV180_004802 [Coemansia sp. RSA 518]|nr:hypothetical protein GGH17_002029 [Coemansia sp. RSA 788]KAJ2163458.1 hypothetical protein GGH15_004452 [Coemansia sp. RSA 562]KAJ2184740.1 hypothetical protein EV181_004220 [Coemansia sp. RSA 532]KAJ2193992.1 hypothetical protein IW144_004175 [Coemansia sp. RSA 522]KAJ2210443.1 hypothetical protein IW143_004190 [Coemansia sp. RSA 520]KAJ2221020.1 hypothetical protein EV180_004802 [Coemansia sp. RSA 518]KAJ2274749.1 hypothetical protein GGH14_004009 [Coemansia sp. RSA 370]KAJ2420722.1 hyp
MQFKSVIATLAFTAMAANAAPVKARQAIDIDQALDQAEAMYNNPQYVQVYGSQVMSLVSAQMTDKNPSEADVYSAFLSAKASMGPSLVSEAVDSMDAIIEQLGMGGEAGAQLSQMMSQLHDSSVISRLSDMINKMLDKVAEEYKDGDIGTPTALTNDGKESQTSSKSTAADDDKSTAEEDDKSTAADDEKSTAADDDKKSTAEEDDKKSSKGDDDASDDDESETSGASSKTMGMFVMSVGAVAGAMAAFF